MKKLLLLFLLLPLGCALIAQVPKPGNQLISLLTKRAAKM